MQPPKRGNRSVLWLWGFGVLLWLTSLVAQASDQLATGITLFNRGQFAEAQQFFEMALDQHPTHPAGAYYLGRIAFENGQYEQASAWFERSVQLDSGNSEYHRWLGRAYGEQAEQAGGAAFFLARKVKRHLEKAVELSPDNVEARFDLLEYYLRAPTFLGGDVAKAKAQAAEIAKRDATVGSEAWRRCDQEEGTTTGAETLPPSEASPGTGQQGKAVK